MSSLVFKMISTFLFFLIQLIVPSFAMEKDTLSLEEVHIKLPVKLMQQKPIATIAYLTEACLQRIFKETKKPVYKTYAAHKTKKDMKLLLQAISILQDVLQQSILKDFVKITSDFEVLKVIVKNPPKHPFNILVVPIHGFLVSYPQLSQSDIKNFISSMSVENKRRQTYLSQLETGQGPIGEAYKRKSLERYKIGHRGFNWGEIGLYNLGKMINANELFHPSSFFYYQTMTLIKKRLSANKNNILSFKCLISSLSLEDAQVLADFLKDNSKLEVLDLEGTSIDGGALKEIIQGVGVNTSLRSLNLNRCNLHPPAIMSIAHLLSQHPSLTEINLASNVIGEEGATNLAQALIENKILKKLTLDKSIGKCGLDKLAQAIKQNKSLMELVLPLNSFGEKDQKEIKKVAKWKGLKLIWKN